MTAEIKQWKDEAPTCDLCVINIKHDEYYLEFDFDCGHAIPHEVVICEKCLDAQSRAKRCAKFPKIPCEPEMINVNCCPLCGREGTIMGININLMECKDCGTGHWEVAFVDAHGKTYEIQETQAVAQAVIDKILEANSTPAIKPGQFISRDVKIIPLGDNS